MDYERWCSMSDEELAQYDVAYLNLLAAEGLSGSESLDVAQALTQIDDWTEIAWRNTRHWRRTFVPTDYCQTDAQFRMMALVTVLQRDLHVGYHMECATGPYNATDSRNNFLHGPLSEYGGTCCSLPILYLAVGRRLGYPLWLVCTNRHSFVRWDDGHGERFNVECATLGFLMDDDEHYRNWPVPFTEKDHANPRLLTNLSPRSELAHHIGERGHCLLDSLRLDETLKAYYFAAKLERDFTGIWATATQAHRIIENLKARHDSIYYPLLKRIDLASQLKVESWQEKTLEAARKDLHRIIGLHTSKRISQFESNWLVPSWARPSRNTVVRS